jgi:hypothetical protein
MSSIFCVLLSPGSSSIRFTIHPGARTEIRTVG